LGEINRKTRGLVEVYIYTALRERLSQLSSGLSLVLQTNRTTFSLSDFIKHFKSTPGLKRSIDKVFEIIVYALFSTLLEALQVKIGVPIYNIDQTILEEFRDFTKKVLGLAECTTERHQAARVYRVGVTNAADTGLDIWANFGVAIQIKHISLTPSRLEDIASGLSADRIIVVCKECEKDVLVSVLKQFGCGTRIQSVITEEELEDWYETALRGKSAELIGDVVLQRLANEIKVEFPLTTSEVDDFFEENGYNRRLSPDFWHC
jgi:type II restriction enzyme